MEIQELSPYDFVSVCNLLSQLWQDRTLDVAALHEVYLSDLTQSNHYNRGMFRDGKLAACCFGYVSQNFFSEGKYFYLSILVVDETCRAQGLGHTMLTDAQTFARSFDCKRFELDSAFFRTRAHEFYESQGFKKRSYVFTKEL